MKTKNLLFLSVILFTLLFTTAHSQAAVVPSTDFINYRSITPNLINTHNLMASDSSLLTGNYAFCYTTNSSNSVLICQVRLADDSLLYEKIITKDDSNDYILEIELSNDNEIYIIYTLDRAVKVLAYDGSGNALFPEFEITPVTGIELFGWQRISLALTQSGFWVVGSRFSNLPGSVTTPDDLNIAYRFDRMGNLQQTIVNDINPAGSEWNCGAAVSSNRSGDLIISWVEVNDPSFAPFIDLCRGSIVSRIFRESGNYNSDFIDVSNTRNDDDAYFGNPSSLSDESGEFVVAWDYTLRLVDFDDAEIYMARVFPVGNGTSIAPQMILNGGFPVIASGTSGIDFAIYADFRKLSYNINNPTCFSEVRLGLDGQLQPAVTFDTNDCGADIKSFLFLNDGSMLLINSRTNINSISGKRYFKPSEIFIDDVSISEGNPARGQGPVAVVSVTLSKPHPTDEDIQVNYYTQDITALSGFDYALSNGTLVFPAGNTLQDIHIPIVADDVFENTETFSLNLELADNAVIKSPQAIVTIINDDTPPPIQNNCDNLNGFCQTIQEPLDGESINLEVILSMDTAQSLDVVFAYETEDVTATAGSDYIGSSGSITIPAGSTQTSLVIPVLGDLVSEVTETFKIKFTSTSTVPIIQPVLDIAILNEVDCLAVLSPIGNDVLIDGGAFSFDIDVEDGCDWTVTPNDAWVQVTSPLTGTNDATVTYNIASQVGQQVFSREGSIDVTTVVPFLQTATHTIVQDGDPSLCPFSVDTSQFDFGVNGGTGSLNVTGLDVCVWDVFSDVPWITITSPTEPVFGDSVVEFTVTTNAGVANVPTATRTSMLDAFFDVTINQTGCAYELSEYTVSISDLTNDNITTNVLAPDTAASPCSWTAVSTASWLLVTDNNAGTGFEQVVMEALQNPSIAPRTGTVLIGDDMFTVVQAGQPCAYDIGATAFDVCPDGNSKQVNISATAGCAWTLESDQSWLNITDNANGIGDENAGIQIMRNNGETDRTGILSFISGDPDPGTQIDSTYNQTGYLVYEPFTGNSLPADFIGSPMGLWQVVNDQLSGSLLNAGLGIGFDSSDQAYCSDCKVEGSITMTSVSSNSEPNIGLVGWFQSDSSYVAMSMNELGNKWRLSLFENGAEMFIEVDDNKLVANQEYQLSIKYDEQFIYGYLAGEQILQLEHFLNQAPSGYPGFMLNNSNGVLDDLTVSGNSANADLIFDGGFEVETFQAPTQCSQ